MFTKDHINSEEDSQWYKEIESQEIETALSKAVSINDPISKIGLNEPPIVEVGTSLKNALKLLQREQKNCVLILDNDSLLGILTEETSF